MKFSLLFVFSVLTTWQLLAQPSNVLFIGNSYTHMNGLYRIYQNLAKSKNKNVIGDTLAVSGSKLKGHALRPNTYKKIKSKEWDYVFIQGYSRELAMDSVVIAEQTIPYAQQLIDSIKRYNPCASIYYYMTWGYEKGHKDSILDDSYSTMQDRIQKGYMQLSRATGGYPIAPVGMVWKNIMEKYPTIDLYANDRAHPSPDGSFAAACTFYTAIYKESSIQGAAPRNINQTDALNIEKVASDYVLTNYEKYRLDTFDVIRPIDVLSTFIKSSKRDLTISFRPKLNKSESYYWEFGDGATSTKRTVTHTYETPGVYEVVLYIKNGCTWFKARKSVLVTGKKEPKKSNSATENRK